MSISIRALTDKDTSVITGRNGTYFIDCIDVFSLCGECVCIDGRSSNTGKLINGGLIFDVSTMDQIARKWLDKRSKENAGWFKERAKIKW